MQLYREKNDGDLIFSDDMYYEPNVDAYVEEDCVGTLDDGLTNIHTYEEVHCVFDQRTFIEYCNQENWNPKDAKNLKEYLRLVEA